MRPSSHGGDPVGEVGGALPDRAQAREDYIVGLLERRETALEPALEPGCQLPLVPVGVLCGGEGLGEGCGSGVGVGEQFLNGCLARRVLSASRSGCRQVSHLCGFEGPARAFWTSRLPLVWASRAGPT